MLGSKIDPRDPFALAVAAVFGILGSLGVWTRLQLTPDDVAQLSGYLLALAAAHRIWQATRKGSKAQSESFAMPRSTWDALVAEHREAADNPEHALPGETPTSECSEMEIAAHQAQGTLRVTPSGLGFVRRPKDNP